MWRFLPFAGVMMISLGMASYGAAAALTVTSEAPGNIFVAGVAPRFRVAGPTATGRFVLTSYWGQQVEAGELSVRPEGVALQLRPLPPGHYVLAVSAVEETVSVRLGVLMDRGGAPLDPDGRVAVDAAAAWLVGPDRWRALAQMVRLAGIPWVRERFSWGEVSRTPDGLEWGKYQTVAEIFHAEGVSVCQVFHDSPWWAREQGRETPNVNDLRDFYRVTKAAAAHFAETIQAWEVWNEPDIGFFPDLADRFAGIQKACYLGLKAGSPDASVLQGSFCRGFCRFDEALFEQGIAPYYDVFNWHIYNTPENYARVLDGYRGLLSQYGVESRPIWLTEAGIRLEGTEGDNKQHLNDADERRQCQFVAPSVVSALAAGTDRYFFFVLPHYLENGVQFGLLRPDLTPLPGFVALSACANLIGDGDYLGELEGLPEGVQGRLFRTARGNTLVLWAAEPTEVTLSCPDGAPMTRFDVFGCETSFVAAGRRFTVKVGPEATYVTGLGVVLPAPIGGPVRARGVLPRHQPSPVFIVGRADLPTDKNRNSYRVSVNEVITYNVDVYNFDEDEPHCGTLRLQLPPGWSAPRHETEITVGPMGRETTRFRLIAREPDLGLQTVRVEADFPGLDAGAAVADFTVDAASLTPTSDRGLSLAVGGWRPSISGNGVAEQSQGPEGEYLLTARYDQPGDRWCYSTLAFDPPVSFAGYDGVSFEVKASADDEGTRIRFMVGEPNAARYYTPDGAPAKADWQRVVFLFRDLEWGAFSSPDTNGKLDLAQVAQIELGSNTTRDEMILQFRDLRLVKLQ